MPEKREEKVPTMSDKLMNIDLSKLERDWGKGSNTAKDMLEFMQNKIAIKQLRQIDEDMNAEESKKKLENLRLTQLYAQGLIPQQAPGQPQTNPADAIAKLFTNEQFMANFTQLTKETQERVIQSVVNAQMMQGAGAVGGMNNMLPLLMLMQQNQQKPPPPPSETDLDKVVKIAAALKGNEHPQQSDPVAMFNALSTILKPYQDATSNLQEKLIETKLDAIASKTEPMTLEKSVEVITMLQDKFGGHQQAETDIAIAEITARTHLQEVQLNLDARKIAEETKSKNFKWQQIGGLLTTVTSLAGPSVMNTIQSGIQGLQQHQNPAQE
jgi:hypothetical protein